MLKAKVIGIGAAGNKGAIELVEQKIIDSKDVILFNTTLKDVPAAYKDLAISIEGPHQGCAKEPGIANDLMMKNLREGTISVDGILDGDDKMVIIITSLEGGTGCGASTVVARYFSEVLGTNVHMFAFSGFEEDSRGLKNTVDWFGELSPKYIVECISNKKFMKQCFNNKFKAEKAANKELASRIKALLGQTIIESEQNIDDADLYKLTTTPGFMTIETANINKIKNVDAFNEALVDAIDNSKSWDVDPTCKRIGVIINANEKTMDYIDGSFEVLRQRFGEPFEFFTHIQSVHEEETVTFIIAGLKMPKDEVQNVYNTFCERRKAVDTTGDDFFNKGFDTSVDGFDMGSGKVSVDKVQQNKAAFFGGVKNTTVKTPTGTAQNITVKDKL